MGAHWKREKVQDHKFDFINVEDFVDNSCWRQFQYMLVFAAIMRGILVYCSDIFTAANLLTNSNPNSFFGKDGELGLIEGFTLPYDAYKYLFTACIVLSFLLLALEIRRARAIIYSRDISYAFTSQIASRYYTVRSYPHYCLFAQINNSKKTVDEVAFFCFFTFRNWKRLILADAPRQLINASILYQIFQNHAKSFEDFFDWSHMGKNDDATTFKKHIRGNLKEFCCHKIDKRIDELIQKNTKNRAMNAQTKNGKNSKDIAMDNLQQPTLPQLDLLEPPPPPSATTPKNVYTMPRSGTINYSSSNSPHQQQRHQEYGYNAQYDNGYSNINVSPQQPGYTANYTSEDYFQAKPPTRATTFDPYAESAFTSEAFYDAYSNKQDEQKLQQKSGRDNYNSKGNSNINGYSRIRHHDDYNMHHRAASPPSQHGSDLDSSHNSNSGHIYVNNGNGNYHGNNGYNSNSNNGYNSNSNNGYNGSRQQAYGSDYYTANGQNASNTMYSSQMSPQSPQRPRRQDTALSRNRSNGGY
ncbi:hypothetical protein BCR41DRAFT_19742 [Lobosporangium transversale]|uniref:Uncharacterized protein n=1 Tax=Lobosporangium transversale TaxID=64571 RepID=A0A1Y2GSH3_9FUNG|nr:hypothetical protein BCR41DRAFT_19742 [Lobosporangium transversale]ORZ21720.1 hypothetical protein BCR41DRAFT_19742 [Lobosporangium transversale]|eukprot:XP_021882971.1 hypothetical protein BCR41DRAFT_19742 [Lobosporangium transversale]